jgi:TPR repeat protein
MLIRLLIVLGVCMGMVGCTPKPFVQSEAKYRAKILRAEKRDLREEERENNPRCAFRCYYERALQDEPCAQYMVSFFYLKGVGVPYCLERSVHWYKRAEQHADRAFAQYEIGKMFLDPKWFKKDEREALIWLNRSGHEGCVLAQNLLGDLYHKGSCIIPRNQACAMEWYRKSAMQHNPIGQYSVGMLYYNGDGVRQNYLIAAHWFHKAAVQGAPYAQYMLARMYQEGLGVRCNWPKAYGWWSLCPQLRFEQTEPEYRALIDPMTPTQRVEAFNLSQQYKADYGVKY